MEVKMSSNLVWVDLEMTGLDVDTDHIIEMACIITDSQLNIIAEAPVIVIHQPDYILDNMNDWCKKHHGDSGLTQAVKNSKVSLAECEKNMLKFIKKYVKKGMSCIAGNSVHCDRVFLSKYMPKFTSYLNYRIVDVSSIKELCKSWYPEVFKDSPPKALQHRALEDIKESIEELKYYRRTIFKNSSYTD